MSDTHVGFSQYHKVTPAGLNQREQDFFDAFARAIDLALSERVDAVLHSGDLFDSVRPTNRAVAFAMEQVRRLGDVPFVVIAGNHETPKLKETGSVLRFLDFLPNAHAVYRGKYEPVRIGDCVFHCVPHAANEAALHEELARATPDASAAYNVLTLHAGVIGVADFKSGEFNEQNVPLTLLPPEFDYVGLGHYHRATRLTPNACYAGSTERSSLREWEEDKGCQLVDLAKARVEFKPIPTRAMVSLPGVDGAALAEPDIAPAVYAAVTAVTEDPALEGAIVRLKLNNVPRHVYTTLDFARIRKLTERALHFQLVPDLLDAQGVASADGAMIGSLNAEFDAFYAKVPAPGLDRDGLRRRAMDFLAQAETGEAAQR